MLDTNTFSYIVTTRSHAARERFLAIDQTRTAIVLSAITESEVRFGFARLSATHRSWVETKRLLAIVTLLPFGREEAVVYATVRARQQAIGRPLSGLDMLIAAHAIAVGATLITADSAFSYVEGLKTQNWATDL